ncbi:Aste57867_8684 [Aphanomyces stellatus]|uniref:Aste57867_8684 protein n=1 Tax=Aphanomyces stellatus TaxID=120398 RepID=A0A485KL25_9STRA|nr:hypothetical protein As57867_008650 [Aphanomyces stellatus]VFT85570.1 Aste57867_8684 [Aphanomyces stellatus]
MHSSNSDGADDDGDRPSYYERNRDQVRENQRLYRESNREKIRAIHKAYYLKNRAKITAYKRERWHQKKANKGETTDAWPTDQQTTTTQRSTACTKMRVELILNPAPMEHMYYAAHHPFHHHGHVALKRRPSTVPATLFML